MGDGLEVCLLTKNIYFLRWVLYLKVDLFAINMRE